jgi:hypothetical protein
MIGLFLVIVGGFAAGWILRGRLEESKAVAAIARRPVIARTRWWFDGERFTNVAPHDNPKAWQVYRRLR